MSSPFISVAEDIAWLRTWAEGEVWNPGPPDDVLRRGSVTLRLLLVDQLIQKAWRHHGFPGQPRVQTYAIDVAEALARLAPHHIVHASAQSVVEEHQTGDVPSEADRFWLPVNDAELTLSEYTEAPALLVNGATIRRREVIQYFANTKGGAHLEVSARVRHKREELTARIAKIEGYLHIKERESLRFELREVGVTLGTAEPLRELEHAIRSA